MRPPGTSGADHGKGAPVEVSAQLGGPEPPFRWLWALIAGAAITALIFLGGFTRIQQVFKLLCLSLLSYVAVLFFVAVRWKTVGLDTLVPHVTWSRATCPCWSRCWGPRSPRTCSSGRSPTGSRRCAPRTPGETGPSR